VECEPISHDPAGRAQANLPLHSQESCNESAGAQEPRRQRAQLHPAWWRRNGRSASQSSTLPALAPRAKNKWGHLCGGSDELPTTPQIGTSLPPWSQNLEERSPLHQLWHLMMRASGAISASAQASLPQPQIGTSLPFLGCRNLSFPDFSQATRCFGSGNWRGGVVTTPPILAPRAENEWRHRRDSLGETATETDWRTSMSSWLSNSSFPDFVPSH
jgi:hypothetical protein